MTSPFDPESMATVETFAGRLKSKKRLLEGLSGMAFDKPLKLIVTGDRGIGKSSLLRHVKDLHRKNQTTYLFAETELNGEETLNSLSTKVLAAIHYEIKQHEKLKKFFEDLMDFLSKFNLGGISIKLHFRRSPKRLIRFRPPTPAAVRSGLVF